MGFIKEPEGVDFLIQGKPLTEKEKKELSEFIKNDKEKNRKKQSRTKSDSQKVKPKNPVS